MIVSVTSNSKFQSLKSTSGQPFDFADKATALLSCYLLSGVNWSGKRFGKIISLHCEVSQDGWRFDDVLVTFASAEGLRRLAISLKSNCQFTQQSAPKDLTTAAWSHFLGLDGGVFQEERDFLGIVTAPHAPKIRDAINGLIEDACNQPEGVLASRVSEGREPSPIKRGIFQSLVCPSDVADQAAKMGKNLNATGLLSRFFFAEFDFDSSPSNSETIAIALCQQCLKDEARENAPDLWAAISHFCHDVRVKGGAIDLAKLLQQLRRSFRLKAHPSYSEAWKRIKSRSVSAATSVRLGLAGKPPLPRIRLANKLLEAIGKASIILLVGKSGTGKSAIARMFCQDAETNGSEYLWFRGRDLELPSPLPLHEQFGLNCQLDELFEATPVASALLVLDGMEACFSEDGFHRVASLVNAAAVDKSGSPWQLLITCQTEDWERVRFALRKGGARVAQEPEEVQVGNFSLAEGREQLTLFPSLRSLLYQPQVSEFILNPKIFDLLARYLTDAVENQSFFATEAALVQWFWREVVCKDGPVSTRDQFLRRFGTHQGDQMEATTAIDSFVVSSSDRHVVSGLVRDRILAEDPDSGLLWFDHDLLADWSRERELQRRTSDLARFLTARLVKPLWHRALRLFGLHLLEEDGTAAKWLEAYNSFVPGLATSDLGRNLLLQSIVFAPEIGPCIERLWPVLRLGDGEMFRDLLTQFRISATKPEPKLVAYYERTQPNLVVHAAARHRVPWGANWAGLFQFLSLHRDDVISIALEQIASLCEIWLHFANPTWQASQIAAELALAAASLVKDETTGRRHHGGNDEDENIAYRALLSASEAMPETVGQMVLELSGRRLSPGVDEKFFQDDESFGIFNTPLGMRKPWPDGPKFSVDNDFRETFLNTINVAALIRANPQVAAEALLALLLDMPRERNYDRRSGLFIETTTGFLSNDVLEMQFPIWFKGPFIHFLHVQPTIALETIVRLVNFATERGRGPAQEFWSPIAIEIEFSNGKQEWVGNERTYFWSLEDRGTSGAVSCALMALERWIYEQIDDGKSIEPVIQYIFANSRSLAFAGLLLRVGRKLPALLTGSLLPLYKVPEFHWLEATSRPSEFDFFMGSLDSQQNTLMRKEWYDQPHRKINLHTFSQRLFLSSPELAPIFENIRGQWLGRASSGAPERPAPKFLEAFAASFDIANYRQRSGSGGETFVEFVPPAVLVERDPEGVKRLREDQMIMEAPFTCMRFLTDGTMRSSVPPAEELWQKFDLLVHIENPEERQGVQTVADGACALAAVLLEFHHEWLRKDPEKLAATSAMLLKRHVARFGMMENPTVALPIPEAMAFCARSVPTIWKEEPDSRPYRAAMAYLVFYGSFSTISALMASSARYRELLGRNFQQLEWLVQSWAVAIHRQRYQQLFQQKDFDFEKWCEKHWNNFINAKLSSPGETFLAIAQPDSARWVPGHHGHTGRRDTGIDIQCLLAAYAWAADLSFAKTLEERQRFIDIHRQILMCSMAAFSVEVPDSRADFDGPYEDEKVLIKTMASIVLQLDDQEDAKALWQPIIELTPKSRFWGMHFMTDLFTVVLENPDRYPKLKRVWREVLEFVFESPAWFRKPGRSNRDISEIWLDILKIESSFWTADDTATLELLRFVSPYWKKWAESSLSDSHNALAFIGLMCSKAAAVLRCEGLMWLQKGIPVDQAWEWDDSDVQSAFARLLVILAEKNGADIKSKPEVNSAFLGFATRLAAQQNGVAVELLARFTRES